MVRALGPIPRDRPVVELGSGTGAITESIVEAFPQHPKFAVEYNATFAGLLTRKFPDLRLGVICASELCAYLRSHGVASGSVGGVLSGLPLTGFRRPLRQKIFAAIEQALVPGGLYVQMTYHPVIWKFIGPRGFHRLRSHRVWRNLPPAVVLVFRKPDA